MDYTTIRYYYDLKYRKYAVEEPTEEYETVSHQHDALYKEILSEPNEFVKFLEKFVTFPSNVSLEKDKFIKTNKSFISSKFARKEVDILYRYNNKPIYFLVEHQSSVDESMPYRLLNYYMEIINDSVDNESLHSKKYSLSTVVPIVLYTGNKKWNVTQR